MPKRELQIDLPIDLPDKKYFGIGEVSKLCDLKPHVLRYWEQVFPQLEPTKRQGRRYYQREDVALVLEIKSLLHEQGFTISGAKAKLANSRKNSKNVQNPQSRGAEGISNALQRLQQMQTELHQFQDYIQKRFS